MQAAFSRAAGAWHCGHQMATVIDAVGALVSATGDSPTSEHYDPVNGNAGYLTTAKDALVSASGGCSMSGHCALANENGG